MKKFYLTTPLYYVNAKPHIGHSYTTVAADVLARYRRLLGYEVLFLTGTDEHGQKVAKASQEAGQTPQQFADELSATFDSLWARLNIRYDDFIRTTEDRHKRAVEAVWNILAQKGDVFTQTYEGWYCTPCESFWPERDLEQNTDDRHVCPQCQRVLEPIREMNYFFKLSKYQTWLMDYIRANPSFIQPEIRRNETLSFLEHHTLSDLCISRPRERLSWGIPSPLSAEHVTYVWFDALINYISALGWPASREKLERFWPCDVHLIGKDILRQHTVYWPIILKALGLEPPRQVFAHGWWIQGKEKMSKSLGNVVNPLDVIDRFGVDAYRYFLMKEVSFGMDGTFSWDLIATRYVTDLGNDLGNLFLRTFSMVNRYCGGRIPTKPPVSGELKSLCESLLPAVEAAMDKLQFQLALEALWRVVTRANKHIEDSAPWKLAKENKTAELESCLAELAEVLRRITPLLWPFMPATAESMWAQMGLAADKLVDRSNAECAWGYFKEPVTLALGKPLFPRLEE